MRFVANKPCNMGGKRYFIGEEIPSEEIIDPVALEKMGVIHVIRDGILPENYEMAARTSEITFSIPVMKEDETLEIDATEAQIREAVKTMQMSTKDAVAHIRDSEGDNTVLIMLNAIDSRTAVKKEAEAKAKGIAGMEEREGDA